MIKCICPEIYSDADSEFYFVAHGTIISKHAPSSLRPAKPTRRTEPAEPVAGAPSGDTGRIKNGRYRCYAIRGHSAPNSKCGGGTRETLVAGRVCQRAAELAPSSGPLHHAVHRHRRPERESFTPEGRHRRADREILPRAGTGADRMSRRGSQTES